MSNTLQMALMIIVGGAFLAVMIYCFYLLIFSKNIQPSDNSTTKNDANKLKIKEK